MAHAYQIGTSRLLGIALIAVGLLAANAAAAIMVQKGNNPVADHDWPKGALDVANLKTRIGFSEGPPFGGGEYSFMYDGTAADFQAALDLFAKMQAPKLQLTIHDGGPAETPFLTDDKNPADHLKVDWYFTVWNPESWKRLHQSGSRIAAEDPNGGFGKDVEPPRIDVFVGGEKGLDISHVHVPANVAVTDERADVAGFKDGSAVVGDVTDLATGKPIAGATLELASAKAYEVWEPVVTARSDAKGHYQFTNAPKGTFGVIARAEGYAPRMLGYAGLRGNTFKQFSARLALAQKLAGVAIDQDGKPAVKVTLRPDSITGPDDAGYILPRKPLAVTDEQGRFELSDLPAGHTQLFAYGDHYLIANALAVQAIPTTDLKIRVEATGEIKGRVVDAAGKPDARGNVRLTPEGGDKPGTFGGSTNVSPDGTFTFENVPPGRYTLGLMVTNPGSAKTLATPIVVKAGATTEVALKSGK